MVDAHGRSLGGFFEDIGEEILFSSVLFGDFSFPFGSEVVLGRARSRVNFGLEDSLTFVIGGVKSINSLLPEYSGVLGESSGTGINLIVPLLLLFSFEGDP